MRNDVFAPFAALNLLEADQAGIMRKPGMTGGQGTTESAVRSEDGTRIGFRCVGSGPGLVLVQGAMGTAYNFEELAWALAPDFTVYMPDRRGRGMAAKPYDDGHEITRDVEDLNAVLVETGASQVFGLSSGAMIALEAARTLPRITRASVYEPPFKPGGIGDDRVRLFNAEVGRGDLASALVSAGRIVGLAPPPIRILPKPIARLLTGAVIRKDDAQDSAYAKLRTLVPAMRYDFNVVSYMNGKVDRLRSIEQPMLLLSGTKSPAYLRKSIAMLHGLLPNAQHIEFAGLDHSGPWNADRGGHPAVVARALRDFFD